MLFAVQCWQAACPVSKLPPLPLTEDTSPEAIAAAQRAAVAEAIRSLGSRATVERISEAAILPPWVVKRRVKELKRMRRQTA